MNDELPTGFIATIRILKLTFLGFNSETEAKVDFPSGFI